MQTDIFCFVDLNWDSQLWLVCVCVCVCVHVCVCVRVYVDSNEFHIIYVEKIRFQQF